MVAMSLYRGNLHRVPDVPRRWIMPTPTISLKDFRKLLARRSKALELLDRNLQSVPNRNEGKSRSDVGKLNMSNPLDNSPSLTSCAKSPIDDKENETDTINLTESSPGFEEKEPDEVTQSHSLESEGEQLSNEDEKRKGEIEEKLNLLKTRKHNLVQALKQVLSAEEYLNREATPRSGLEGNIAGNGEVGETEDKNVHHCRLPRTCSVSLSAESPMRRPLHQNAITHPSPSRFAPALAPSMSLSGTNFAASSPSPAASGGTSAFRDTRQPSYPTGLFGRLTVLLIAVIVFLVM